MDQGSGIKPSHTPLTVLERRQATQQALSAAVCMSNGIFSIAQLALNESLSTLETVENIHGIAHLLEMHLRKLQSELAALS